MFSSVATPLDLFFFPWFHAQFIQFLLCRLYATLAQNWFRLHLATIEKKLEARHSAYEIIQTMRWVNTRTSIGSINHESFEENCYLLQKLSMLSFSNLTLVAVFRITWSFSCSSFILTRQSLLATEANIFRKMIGSFGRPTSAGAGFIDLGMFRVICIWNRFHIDQILLAFDYPKSRTEGPAGARVAALVLGLLTFSP